MYPVLFQHGRFMINTYGAMFFVAFILVTVLAAYRVRKRGLDPDVCPRLLLVVILSSLGGAKLHSILHSLAHGHLTSLTDGYEWRQILFGGGLIAFGGVLGGTLGAYIYFRIKRLDFLAYGDAFAPFLGLGVAIMRLGCFAAGCCWGKQHVPGLSVDFTASSWRSAAALYQRHYHLPGLFPSQLFAALNGILIMAFLFWLDRKRPAKGTLIAAFYALYCGARSIEDLTRYYHPTEKALGLTYNQWISLSLLLGLAVIWKSIKGRLATASGLREMGSI